MIVKRFNKVGRVSKPYYTQNNEQEISLELGDIRKKIESKINGDKPYDIYNMIADQSKRIDVLEAIIKKLDPSCVLEPKLDIGDATNVYYEVNDRMKQITDILQGK